MSAHAARMLGAWACMLLDAGCGGEAQPISMAILIHEIREARQYPFRRSDWILDPGAENREENRFRIGRSGARRIKLIGNERLDTTAPSIPVAEKTVMHEQPFSTRERMTIDARDRGAGCRPDMGKK